MCSSDLGNETCVATSSTGLARSSAVPFGTRAPGFLLSPTDHSYGTPTALTAKGFTGINTSLLIPYGANGQLDFSQYGGKEAWLCRAGNAIAALKKAGLVVLIEGELQEANAQQGEEPGPVPTEIRETVATSVSAFIPEIATLLEKYKVEYWSPMGESEIGRAHV